MWRENEYTNLGKWMDGWETRRKRKIGNDYVIIALVAETQISHVCVDTCFFTGNFPPKFSIRGDKLSTGLSERQFSTLSIKAENVLHTDSRYVGISETWRQNRDGKLGGEASEDDYERISPLHSEVIKNI